MANPKSKKRESIPKEVNGPARLRKMVQESRKNSSTKTDGTTESIEALKRRIEELKQKKD